MKCPLKIAVVQFNLGPYHVARATALAKMDNVRPIFIELAAALKSHPWDVDRRRLQFELHTLFYKPWEHCSYGELCRALISTLKKIQPDVVVTSSFRPFIMLRAARWARSQGIPSIFFYDSLPWDRRRYWISEMIKRLTISRYYSGAFVAGKAHRDYVMSLGMPEGRIWCPYDVVDNDHFANHAGEVRTNTEIWRRKLDVPKHYFLYVGRLAPEKNLLRLLEAHRLFRLAHPSGWPLVIVGDGPQRTELEREITGYPNRQVVMKPFQQSELLPAYYALADSFVLPSLVDPWGLVVNEAMACGLPVLISKLCGSGFDLVEEGVNGFTFDPSDPLRLAGLFAKMFSLPSDQREQMGEQSRRIIAAYSPDISARGLVGCISAIANN